MQRQLYNIGGYQYVVDIYDANIDLLRNPYKRKFVMLRNFTLMNDIITDNDIYFIEKSVFDKFIKEIHYSKDKDTFSEKTSKIVFPIPEGNVTSFSNLYSMFNSNFKNYSLYNNYVEGLSLDEDTFEYGSDVYELLDVEGNPKWIDCNKVRIYHPANTKAINGILYIDNYINDIHFHYFCNLYQNFSTNSETEFRINNYIYSEFVEIAYPNIEQLFKFVKNDEQTNKEIFNVYYHENLNTVISTKNDSFIERIIFELKDGTEKSKYHIMSNANDMLDDAESYFDKDAHNIQRVPLNLLIQPFRIVKEVNPITNEEENVKLYIKHFKSFENNYITYPINFTIFPYDYVDSNNGNFIPSYKYTTVTNTYTTEYKFSLTAEIGFTNFLFSIIAKFNYPNKEKWLNEFNYNETLALREAYKFYYNVDEDEYKYFWVNRLLAEMPEEQYSLLAYVDEHWDNQNKSNTMFDSDENNYEMAFAKDIVDEDGVTRKELVYEVSNKEKLRRIIERNYKGIKDELRDWEVEDDYQTAMDFMGYRIQIFADKFMKNVIYDTTVTSTFETLDNFAFNIDDIFKSWNEVPDVLICQVMFIDRILGNVLTSNLIPLHKDAIKYMIIKDVPTIHSLNKINENMKEITLNSDILKTKEELFTALDYALSKIALKTTNVNTAMNEAKQIIRNFYDEFLSEELEQKRFNFIDTINVITTKESQDSNVINNVGNKSTILFKPVYFRTYDLQNIKLRSRVSQKIGINLGQYMSKVEAFKLKLDDIEYTEIGRNDVYVIFDINANMITSSGGTYNIVNQDDEYISSGNWIIY